MVKYSCPVCTDKFNRVEVMDQAYPRHKIYLCSNCRTFYFYDRVDHKFTYTYRMEELLSPFAIEKLEPYFGIPYKTRW